MKPRRETIPLGLYSALRDIGGTWSIHRVDGTIQMVTGVPPEHLRLLQRIYRSHPDIIEEIMDYGRWLLAQREDGTKPMPGLTVIAGGREGDP